MTEDMVGPERSFLQNLGDVFLAPSEGFKAIAARPRWVVPFVVSLALSVTFLAIWTTKVDPHEFIKAQMEEAPRSAEMPADQKEKMVEMQAAWFTPSTWGFGLVAAALWPVILGAYFLFVFRFFYGANELTFKQSFTIALFANLAVGLVQTPVLLGTLALKGDWTLNPGLAFQAGPALLLDRMETAKWLYALASSIDFFSLWPVALLAIGYGVATKRGAGSAAWAVVGSWLIIVLIKVGFTAVF